MAETSQISVNRRFYHSSLSPCIGGHSVHWDLVTLGLLQGHMRSLEVTSHALLALPVEAEERVCAGSVDDLGCPPADPGTTGL